MEPQTVRESSAKNLRRQVATLHSTQRTFRNHPGVRNRQHRGRKILPASLAAEGEVAALACGQVEHSISIGEETAKLIHNLSDSTAGKKVCR
jgi:hypothetical protein